MRKRMTNATAVAKQRRVRRSEAEWRDLFARFEQSEQIREVFCAEQGVVLSSFIRWWKKLHQRSPQQPAMVEEPVLRGEPENPYTRQLLTASRGYDRAAIDQFQEFD
jgi:hypothetical protein